MDQEAINKIEESTYKNRLKGFVEGLKEQGKKSNAPILNNMFRKVDGKLVQVMDSKLLAAVKRTVVPSLSEIVTLENSSVAVADASFATAELVAE